VVIGRTLWSAKTRASGRFWSFAANVNTFASGAGGTNIRIGLQYWHVNEDELPAILGDDIPSVIP